jgi:hypothetical protein
VKLEDVKATCADGVLEVSVPLPSQPEAKVHTVEIQELPKGGRAAASSGVTTPRQAGIPQGEIRGGTGWSG